MKKSAFYEIGKHVVCVRVHTMFLFILVLMWFSCPFSGASERKTLQAGIIDFFPLGYEENGSFEGLHVQFIRAISRESGVPIRVTLRPYPRIKRELVSGEVDVSILHYTEGEREIATALGGKLTETQNIIVAKKGVHYTSFADLHGKIVAKVRGASYDDRLEKNDAIEIFEVRSYQQAIKMLLNGRVDAFAGTDIVMYAVARELGFTKEDFSEKYVYMNSGNLYLTFSNTTLESHHEDVKKLEWAVKTLVENGTLKKIINSYLK